MKSLLVLVVAVLGAIGLVWGTATHVVPESGRTILLSVALPVIVILAGLGSYSLKRAREKSERTNRPDSIERDLARRAAERAMIDGVLCGLVFGLVALIFPTAPGSMIAFGIVVVILIDFYTRLAILLRTSGSHQ